MNWSAAMVAEVPPGVVTVTSTVPVPAGEVAVMEVALLTVNAVAAVAPNLTAVAPVKPVPVMVTRGAAGGRARRRADGGDRRCGGDVGELVSGRGRRGAARGGDRDVDRAGARRGGGGDGVALLTVNAVAAVAPNLTAVAPVKPVPVMVDAWCRRRPGPTSG